MLHSSNPNYSRNPLEKIQLNDSNMYSHPFPLKPPTPLLFKLFIIKPM